jgi:Family of unknown function (DUF5999)
MTMHDSGSSKAANDFATTSPFFGRTHDGKARHACAHEPRCPDAAAEDRDAARTIVNHPEQGWNLLCNGVVLFDDSGEILPDGHCLQARRAELTAAALHRRVA